MRTVLHKVFGAHCPFICFVVAQAFCCGLPSRRTRCLSSSMADLVLSSLKLCGESKPSIEVKQPEASSAFAASGVWAAACEGSSEKIKGTAMEPANTVNHFHIHHDTFKFKDWSNGVVDVMKTTVKQEHHHHYHYHYSRQFLLDGNDSSQQATAMCGESGSVGDDVTARVGSCAGMQPEHLLENPVESPVRMFSRPEGDCSSPVPKLRRLNASQFGATSANGRH